MDKVSLIFKTLSDKADEAEKKELAEWLAASEGNRMEYEDIRLLWDNSNPSRYQHDGTRFYDGLRTIHAKMRAKRLLEKRRALRTLVTAAWAATLVFFLNPPVSAPRYRFDNDSLEQIIYLLERDYSVVIEVTSEAIMRCRYSGTFCDLPVRFILDSVSKSLNLSCRQVRPREYRLLGTGCSFPSPLSSQIHGKGH